MTTVATSRLQTRLLWALVVSACQWLATGCGSKGPEPSSAGGKSGAAGANAGTGGGLGASDAGGFAGADGSSVGDCNSVELTGQVIVGEYLQGQAPAAQGGSIADGTYDAREYQAFVASKPQPGAPPARLFRQALRIFDGATREESADSLPIDGGEVVARMNRDLLVFGENLTLSYTCPPDLMGERDTIQFSVLGQDLILIAENTVTTYRRR